MYHHDSQDVALLLLGWIATSAASFGREGGTFPAELGQDFSYFHCVESERAVLTA
jgi:hypothetical protein